MLVSPWVQASLVLLAYLALCAGCFYHYRRKQEPPLMVFDDSAMPDWLVAYASQSGTAERIAHASAKGIQATAQSVRVLPLNRVNEEALRSSRRALFVVSTYGEGEPPDNGAAFARRFLKSSEPATLEALDYGVLALGDSSYAHFCDFGRQLHQGLASRGATPLFDWVPVDRGDNQALGRWQQLLQDVCGARVEASAQPLLTFTDWQLVDQRWLNPGSPGAPVYALTLQPLAAMPEWQPGDIVHIKIGAEESAPVREYSIASTMAESVIRLVVRQHRLPDGRLGLGSGWLTRDIEQGHGVKLAVRSNPSFHPPEAERPLILIGAGTGIAGLRSHLRARAEQGIGRNWLLLGERTRLYDHYFADELNTLSQQQLLQRLDLSFSRDGDTPHYVQDALLAAGDTLRQWVSDGAAIYVCGSRLGMAEQVDIALRALLGGDLLAQLLEEGRYRRDVY